MSELWSSDAVAHAPRSPGGAPAGDVEAERARLLAAEREARARAERLQEATAAIVRARTAPEVARAVALEGARALGACEALVAVVSEDGATIEVMGSVGLGEAEASAWRRFPNEGPLPIPTVVREQAPLVLPSPEALADAYPAFAPGLHARGVRAALTYPLALDPEGEGHGCARAMGAMHFNLPVARAPDVGEVAFLLSLGRLGAQALDRARALDAEHAAREAAERARAEAEAARAEAEAANRAKSDFLATMSHELRTPLNAIQGHVQLIEMELHGPLTAAQREALRRIDRAQRHLLRLITDVLDFAKLEAGKVRYDVQAVPVADVVAEALAIVEPQLVARSLALDLDVPGVYAEGPPAPAAHAVWADREKLHQVLLNLLANAIKFTAPGGRVGVAVADLPGQPEALALHVRDTGIGIEAAELDRIFLPFVQAPGTGSALTRPHEGTGLGLAISRDLARGMGGELACESTPGRGSTFTVTLRRVETPDGISVDRRVRGSRRHGDERRRLEDRRKE